MRWVLLTLCAFLQSCILVSDEQRTALGESMADLKAISEVLEQPLQADALKAHAAAINDMLGIDQREFRPRVSANDWRINESAAHNASIVAADETRNAKGYDFGMLALWGTAAFTGVIATARVLTSIMPGHPLTLLFGFADRFMGGTDIKKKQLRDDINNKILDTLEEYKKIDPEWRKHWIYERLSDAMSEPEKAHVKHYRAKRS